MPLETELVKAVDGIELFVRRYRSHQHDPSRVLYWVHGVGEHGGRHEHVAELLNQQGWTMIVADLRGHGRSGGVRTHVTSFDQYVDDLNQVWVQLDLMSHPPTLFGHSMGGLVAVRAIQMQAVDPAALVLSSPLLGLKLRVNPVKELLGRILVRILPTTRFSNGIDAKNMTRDSEFSALRRSDPLIHKTVTAGWFFAMQAALVAARRDAPQVSLPVFAIQGTNDQTTDPGALEHWWQRITTVEKHLLVLPDHVHELLFESDWQQTTIRVLEWLEQHRPRFQ